ncbi:MAG: hypothetical protein LBI11_01380 [Streptococcaceae bacterium]|jgi:accessory secretory protein Asp2|nr:hypothetical protein [Streptococcaceae bacterium]
MKIFEIGNGEHAGAEALSVSQFLATWPACDFLLLDASCVTFQELSALTERLRSRMIGFVSADREKRAQLLRFGHFDFSEIWTLPNLVDELTYMTQDLAQTQGFSMAPDEGAVIPDNFSGNIERLGRYELRVSGNFKTPEVVVAFKRLHQNWGKPIFVVPFRRFYNAPGKHHLTFDYTVLSGDLRVTYEIFTYDRQGNLLKTDRFEQREGTFEAFEAAEFRGRILLHGRGSVRLGKVWTYKDKHGLGWYQLGDARHETADGEFVHSLYIPGKRPEKLIVGFSGNLSELPHYERQTMATYGFPVLLFCDLRARGGAFHVGNATYEAEISRQIDAHLTENGLKRSDLILIGWSMGSFPAVYYGLKMQAGHVLAAKPLLHLGRVTSNTTVMYRAEPSMIAARAQLTGRVDLADEAALDAKILSALTEAKSGGKLDATHFYSFHMSADELDKCVPFFAALPHHAITEALGFHADKIGEMGQWINQVLDELSEKSAEML